MKKLHFKPSSLQILYLIFFIILFALLVFTPMLITGSVNISGKLIIEEELIEGTLLSIVFFIGVMIVNLYKNEGRRQAEIIAKIKDEKKSADEKLNDAFKYIGMLNVQIQEIKSIFNNSKRYPETKNDFKRAYHFYSKRVLGIVNINWVLFRIINQDSQKTISEHFESRGGVSPKYPHISNKAIIQDGHPATFTSVVSSPANLNILISCTLPVEKISKEERIFIQAITNELTMLFIVLNSSYLKSNGNNTNKET